MRSIFLGVVLAGLAQAAPAPQDIDFALAEALPNPKYTTTLEVVHYNPSAIFNAALPQITSSGAESDAEPARLARRNACTALATGAGPVPTPDTASAFLADSAFASSASAAAVPAGYSQTFSNLQASNNAYGYMGYTTLASYDVENCANQCNDINGCMAINIFFERDPTEDPGTGASGCANPPSTTFIKCVFWGGPVNAANAVNTGETRNQFQVVIAGSNGYVNNSIATPAGYTTAVDLGNKAIDAPPDEYGYDSFLGDALFTSGPFDAQLCADACSTKSAYNVANPPSDGSPVVTCQFFNTFILYVNDTSHLQGQYCAMYSETWSPSYATNVGQTRGDDHYLIEYSYSFSNASNAGAPSANAAVHQASRDISYATLQSFCSNYLGYSTPVVTATAVTTVTQVDTVTVTSGSGSNSVAAAKRQAPSSTPAVLTKYPSNILSSACSLQATPVSVTSTETVQTLTMTAATTLYTTVTEATT